MGKIRRRLQEAAMGVSGQGNKYISPKTQLNGKDNEIRKIIKNGPLSQRHANTLNVDESL